MDSSRLNEAFDEIYIPPSPKVATPKVPEVAPSLIMQDRQTDTTHHLGCGCCPDACIHKRAWWGPEDNFVRPSLVAQKSSSSLHNENYA